MRRLLLWLLLPMLLLLLGAELPSRTAKGDDSETAATEKSRKERTELAFFEERIRPVLIDQCYECHSKDADDVGGELLVDSRAGLLEGGQTGPAVVPGDASRSLLISALEYHDFEMPPAGQLPEATVRDFRQWVARGAIDPRRDPTKPTEPAPAVAAAGSELDKTAHWSFRPIDDPQPPAVQHGDWPRTDADRFVLAKLESEGLTPNGDADPATLLRRVSFDLIGLPPSPAEVSAFRQDPAEAHFAEIVDRLLASHHFGERWGRHWLDVARYGESAGSSRDVLMLYAWRYRDYVIDAWNRDVPFDRFVTEQLAGDLLPAETPAARRRLQVATGLLSIGSKSLNGGNLNNDIVDDQIDVVSKAVLGLTVACARCHDHKFDPIPTADYYALAGIFHSTNVFYGGGTNRPSNRVDREKVYLRLGPPLSDEAQQQRTRRLEALAKADKQLEATKKKVAKLRRDVPKPFRNAPQREIPASLAKPKAKKIAEYQAALETQTARQAAVEEARAALGPEPDYALGVQDARKITDANLLIRGEKNKRGDKIPRGFLTKISLQPPAPTAPAVAPIDDRQSGRRQLAAWMVHPSNPLSPRVAVNRIWQHLMGSGLVETVDNFGWSGMQPSHPHLLDHLAHRFVDRHGWSSKAMIRELVLSRSYRMSSAYQREAYALDPDNRLRWRMSRRRLEAEPLRDAILAVSGLLQREPLEGSLVLQIGEGEVGRNLKTQVLDQPFDHRSVYLPVIRGIVPASLKLFDFPEPSNVQGQRDANTTPKQSLYLLNSPFALRAAKAFAGRLAEAAATDAERIRLAHQLCFAQPPSTDQLARAEAFLAMMTAQPAEAGEQRSPRQIAWTAYCQSLLASAPFRFLD